MLTRVTMPKLGESVTEGTVDRWLKQEGDWVALYEPLVEVITDKVNAEVPSPVTGRLVKVIVPAGQTWISGGPRSYRGARHIGRPRPDHQPRG